MNRLEKSNLKDPYQIISLTAFNSSFCVFSSDWAAACNQGNHVLTCAQERSSGMHGMKQLAQGSWGSGGSSNGRLGYTWNQ